MTKPEENTCPCSSKKPYEACCKPFHDGTLPQNALQLMRSRYSAYALNLPEYIIKTTHPASPEYSTDKFAWKRSISKFSKASIFTGLEVLEFKENPSLAIVTFTANLTQDGKDSSFSEKSFFEHFHGKWLYRGGQVADANEPNLITTKELRLLPLAYYGNPILVKKAEPVEKISEDILNLVEAMVETMDAANGIGLAAPQIHHSIRLFIVRTSTETADGEVEFGEIKVYINPKILSQAKETWEESEGCLSIPGVHAPVNRSVQISVKYTDLEGNEQTEELVGWGAKVFLHEYDHIEGVLFIDHLDPKN